MKERTVAGKLVGELLIKTINASMGGWDERQTVSIEGILLGEFSPAEIFNYNSVLALVAVDKKLLVSEKASIAIVRKQKRSLKF